MTTPTEWPAGDVEFAVQRLIRAIADNPARTALARSYLAHLGVHGDDQGRPVTDLRRWITRQSGNTIRRLLAAHEAHSVAARAAGKSGKRGDVITIKSPAWRREWRDKHQETRPAA